MEWYHYISCFFAEVFFPNFVPHIVYDISGNRCPAPFSKPHGIALSSPILNVVWALLNLVPGNILVRFSR